MDKPRIYVDFNEMVNNSIVLLSKDDSKIDSTGNIIKFYEGMPVSIYSDDQENGEIDNLIADGIAIKYDLSKYKCWNHVKWCCQIDEKGIMHESDLKKISSNDYIHKKIAEILNSGREYEFLIMKLKEIIYQLKDAGKKRDEIYAMFNKYYEQYEKENKIYEMDIIGDCMDMVTGWYVGKNIKWE
ncbi:MAG: hypothetical protein LBC96_06010 [Lachnospiraceae bacterium]|jgi:predicted metal-binding transcription factor (methanogenesis marker protein 9)|nr:hypothetical protein [Lachnospiraceae bacterium]